MESSSSSIEFIKPMEKETSKFIVTPEVFHEGRLFASQNWVTPGDIRKAHALAEGNDLYGEEEVMGYSFTDSEGRACFLVGDGHHRAAVFLAEGKELSATIDARIKVTPEMLLNPSLAAQKLAILGIEGIWPFRDFMKEFVEVKVNMNGSRGK